MSTPRLIPRSAVAVAALVCAALLPATAGAGNGDDPFLARQWGLTAVGAPEAWAVTTGAGVTIGIVDTGVDLAHEDLAGKIVAHTACNETGGDPAKCTGSGQDEGGHGTHVAGIAAALRGNGKGVAGVAPDAKLAVARPGDTPEDITAGIKWVVDHGARVVNVSLGPTVFLTEGVQRVAAAIHVGVEYAWAHGAVAVVAAGNENVAGLEHRLSDGIGSYQYRDLDALVVGATGRDDHSTGYSNPTGKAKWSLLAPGGTGGIRGADLRGADFDQASDIYSTYWVKGQSNQYGYNAGTSMAAPHVTGAVALLLAQGLSHRQAVERILATVDTSVACGANSPTCRGRLDVARAVGVSRHP